MFVPKSGLIPKGAHKYMYFNVYSLSLHQDLLHGDDEGIYSVFGHGSKEYLIK